MNTNEKLTFSGRFFIYYRLEQGEEEGRDLGGRSSFLSASLSRNFISYSLSPFRPRINPWGGALLLVHPLIRSGEALPRDSYRGCMLKSKTSGANHPLKSFRIDKGRPFRAVTAILRNIATEILINLVASFPISSRLCHFSDYLTFLWTRFFRKSI